jgi:AAHS family 4-hydroxybenzoate transporter-like MFS transporter
VVDLFHGLGGDLSLTSWLPTLMRETGATMERAAFIGGLFQFGGVLSALFIGWAMDRLIRTIISAFYFVAGLFAVAVGQSLSNPTLLAFLVLCAGIAINGAQSSMPALSARFIQRNACNRYFVDDRYWSIWCGIWCLDWCSFVRQ